MRSTTLPSEAASLINGDQLCDPCRAFMRGAHAIFDPFNDCAMAPSQPLLEARGVTNRFRGVEALKGVDIDVHADSVIALLGDNGAGNPRW